MEIVDIVSSPFFTAIMSGLGGACLGAMFMVVKYFNLMKRALGAILWREIKTLHQQAVAQGGLSIDDRTQLEIVYKLYHAMNMNGTGTKMYEDAMDMPIF